MTLDGRGLWPWEGGMGSKQTKPEDVMKSRQTLNHCGTSGRQNNNYNNNAQETGMSKLHITSGTKTCNRLKSILLFPCDKWNTEYRSHYTCIQKQDTTKRPFQRPNTWTRHGNQNPAHPLVFSCSASQWFVDCGFPKRGRSCPGAVGRGCRHSGAPGSKQHFTTNLQSKKFVK